MRVGYLLASRIALASEEDEAGTHILVYRVAYHLVLSLQMVDTILFVGELPTALGALEGILLAALVLQVTVQVVVPVVGPLTIRARIHAFRAIGVLRRCFGRFVGRLLLGLGPFLGPQPRPRGRRQLGGRGEGGSLLVVV